MSVALYGNMETFGNLSKSIAVGCLGLLVTACGGDNPPPGGGTGGTTSEGGEPGVAGNEVGGKAGQSQGGMSGGGRPGGGRGGNAGRSGHGGRGGQSGAGAGNAGAGNAGSGAIGGEAGIGTSGEGGTSGHAGGGGVGGSAGIAGSAGLGGSGGVAGTTGLGGSGASAGSGAAAGTGATAGTGGQVDACATNNGGCDPLTACTDGGGTRSCSACPRGYSGTGETGCTPKLCDGAPDLDCACIKVTLDGDDAAAIASHGGKPFHDVQLALDFASEHPEVASKVCVVGGPDCSFPLSADAVVTYPAPDSGDFTMHDGVSLYGSYESTTFTRCDSPRTVLSLTSPAGVVFPNTITHPTVIDGFELLHFDAPSSTGMTIRGAKGVVVSSLQISGGDSAVDLYGVDLSAGAQATLQDVEILMQGHFYFPAVHPSGKVYGIRAIGSEVTADGCNLMLNGGEVSGVWLEHAAGSLVQDSVIRAYESSGGRGIHVEGASASLTANRLTGMLRVGAELIDAGTLAFSATENGVVDGLDVLRSRVSASVNFESAFYGTGVLLDTSPGSVVAVTASSGQFSNVVRVVGDATDTQIGVTADVLGGGIEFADCGGAAPLVTGSSLRVRGVQDAIAAFGDCHPRIENNPRIVSVALDNQLVANGIHCGNGSLCTISDNADVRVDIQQSTPSPLTYNLAAIRCEPGSCGDIVGNHVSGLALPNDNMTLGYIGVHGYGIVGSGGLVAKNSVRAGCAVDGAGIIAAGGLVENNFVWGPGCFSTHSANTTGTALQVSGAPGVSTVVDSNTLFGSAASFAGLGTRTAFGVRYDHGDAVFRNNIITGATADFTGGTPSFFQNNDLPESTYLLGTTLLTNMDAINALAPGFSANFSATPGFAADNLHLVANSACVNAGTPEGAPSDDFEGDPRDTHPDVGADEWNGSVPSDPCLGVSCSGHGICHEAQGAGVCTCSTGYVGPDCSSLDLCVSNNGGCDALTTCTGFPGGRTCGACPEGYNGTGETGCTSIACAGSPCPVTAICTPTAEGGHTCTCNPGTTGANCEFVFGVLGAGDDFTCGLRNDHQIICWGRNDQGQTNVPPGSYQSLAVGPHAACAIRTDSTLACWGYSSQGVTSPPAGYFGSLAVGDNYACALSLGTPTCWGALPTPPSGKFDQIAIGDWHACGIRQGAQDVVCWGVQGVVSDHGQMNPPPGSFGRLSLNATTSCGTRQDSSPPYSVECWGAALGSASPPTGSLPYLSLGASAGCAAGSDIDSNLQCWGSSPEITAAPADDGGCVALAVGARHACMLKWGNSLVCWGDNTYGESASPY